MNRIPSAVLAAVFTVTQAMAQSAPTTRPAQSGVDVDRTLDQLLQTQPGAARPLQPATPETDKVDLASTRESVAPKSPAMPLKPEGNMVSQQIGWLQKADGGKQWELHFDSDGRSLQDPPMVVLPNLKLAGMEQQLKQASRDLRFRVTGVITEYHGRNYVLIEKYEIVADADRPIGE